MIVVSKRWVSIVIFLLCSWLGNAETLHTVKEIRALELTETMKALPVEMDAIILKASPPDAHGCFVHDGDQGIYLSFRYNELKRRNWAQGDRILIKGVTAPGLFLPHIIAEEVTPLGKGNLPEPIELNSANLFTPELDCQWIKLRGVIVGTVRTGHVFSLRIAFAGKVINLALPRDKTLELEAKKFVNRLVTVYGVAATQSNDRRQMTGRIVQVQSLGDIVPVSLVNGEIPALEIDQLLRMDNGSLEQVKVRGAVTHQTPFELFLQDETGSLLVRNQLEKRLEIGDEVEVVGTVLVEPFSPSLRGTEVSKKEEKKEVSPLKISFSETPFPYSWHHALVTLEANLLEVRKASSGYVLSCEAEGHVFDVSLMPEEIEMVQSLEAQSRIGLQGICVLRSSQSHAHSFTPDGFSLLLRRGADLWVIDRPSWWTIERIVTVLLTTLAAIFVSLLWVWLLHKKVKSQTLVIGAQLEREAVMNERQRLARELHDSLEQNMSGLALQLTAASSKLEQAQLGSVKSTLMLAQKMLSYCQRESRESIYDLRRSSEGLSGKHWHDELLLDEAERTGAEIIYDVEGEEAQLDRTVSRHLAKIIREASFNSLRHGKARTLKINHIYGPNFLEIMISDDGCGFDTELASPKGHFGIIGMKERAKRIGAKLVIKSVLGKGTILRVVYPLPKKS